MWYICSIEAWTNGSFNMAVCLVTIHVLSLWLKQQYLSALSYFKLTFWANGADVCTMCRCLHNVCYLKLKKPRYLDKCRLSALADSTEQYKPFWAWKFLDRMDSKTSFMTHAPAAQKLLRPNKVSMRIAYTFPVHSVFIQALQSFHTPTKRDIAVAKIQSQPFRIFETLIFVRGRHKKTRITN